MVTERVFLRSIHMKRTFKINGITCQSCIDKITAHLDKNGVQVVSLDK